MNCRQCGHTIEHADARFCPNCAAPLEREPDVVEGVAVEEGPAAPGPGSVPFEDPSRPFLERLWATLALSFSDPKRLYSNMHDADLTAPVIYGVLVGSVAMIIGIFWQLLFGSIFTMFDGYGVEDFAVSGAFNVILILLAPFLVVVGLFISTAIYHVCLLLVGTRSRGFGITLRAMAYGYGPNLLAIIPFCGGFIGAIWVIVLTILGAFYGHRTDAWRAVVAYFIPLIVCCGLMTMLWMVVAGVVATQSM